MSVSEILEQFKALSISERKRLLKLMIDSPDDPQGTGGTTAHTGAEIAAALEAMDPIELVDPHIEDPVEWVKAQRRKRSEKLKPYWNGEK